MGRTAGRLAAAAMVFAALLPAAAVTPEERLRALAGAAGQGEPLARIGLDTGRRLLVSASRPFQVLDPATGEPVWEERHRGELAFVADGGPDGEPETVFRVQAGAFGSLEAAEAEKRRLEQRFGERGIVHYVPDRRSWRVRLGRASGREALTPLLEKMRASGLEGLWVAEEPAEKLTGVTLRVVDELYDSRASGLDRIAVVPAPGHKIEVEGRPYRGVIEVRISPWGTVRAINWIELEQYLLGVVPAELGPAVWPQLEALKAQAVAARTYAWRNRGQFDDEGFDLCATPRCQVYGGAASEHPLSDQAVAETRGEILHWNGQPATTLYTATCGGHTEDVANVFAEERAPYLRGVPCRAEVELLRELSDTMRGRVVSPLSAETGQDVTRDWALLSAAGVLGAAPGKRDLATALGMEELHAWTTALLRLSGRPVPARPESKRELSDLGETAAALVEIVGWGERASVLISPQDAPALLRDPEAQALPVRERMALAYLALVGGVTPFPDGTFGASYRPTRARMIPALARIGDAYESFGLRDAVFGGASGGMIRLIQGRGSLTLPLAHEPYLFALTGERAVPAKRLDLWPGDRVRFRTDGEGRVDFLEMRPPVKGVSDDRAAKVYSWDKRVTRAELEQSVNRRIQVGRLRELEVVRRGVSERIVELRFVGSRGSAVVRGFDLRRALDLLELPLVIEPQRQPGGELEAVVFAGKGWGHGVGLCQVGAYGMALRGKGYRSILAHYYRGTTLEKISPPTP